MAARRDEITILANVALALEREQHAQHSAGTSVVRKNFLTHRRAPGNIRDKPAKDRIDTDGIRFSSAMARI
jgi:hypothetical protein